MQKLLTRLSIIMASLLLILVIVPSYADYKYEKTTGNYSTIGAEFYDRISTIKKLLVDKKTKGVVIVKVYSDTPAAKAGLMAGDIITSINGQDVKTFHHVIYGIEHTPVGQVVSIVVKHNASNLNLSIPVTAATSISNPDFQAYYAMRLEYGRLVDVWRENPLDSPTVNYCKSSLYKLLKDFERTARAKGDTLLAEKYAIEANKFQ